VTGGRDAEPERTPAPGWLTRLGVGRVLGLTIGVLLVMAALGVVLAILAEVRLADRRELAVDEIGPALVLALALENALVDQETGVQGYVLTGEERFLEPYAAGVRGEREALAALAAHEPGGQGFAEGREAVRTAADRWRARFVRPALDEARAGRVVPAEDVERGRRLFREARVAAGALRADLAVRRERARADLFAAADRLNLALIATCVLLALSALAAFVMLRRLITQPLVRLGGEARRVAGGDFATPLPVVAAPREIADVRRDVEAMRERIVRELAAAEEARARVEEQAAELTRSNADLEQFAYVASHDLQEPLRKIASFCQVLERRYRGQLDERADQYIDFIVDGAKRMQLLINDLLAFSRVGRRNAGHEAVDTRELAELAVTTLSVPIEESGARVEIGDLPVVSGERALLLAVLQNLIGNAVKFRGERPPLVRVGAERDGGEWRFSVTDNGIGIAPGFAERVFVIFQRLHAREAYEGTGIGLALCRKIVEYHGGRIWLDTDHGAGTRIMFTLPVPEDEGEEEA
jgi:signal transduction histidine kinase